MKIQEFSSQHEFYLHQGLFIWLNLQHIFYVIGRESILDVSWALKNFIDNETAPSLQIIFCNSNSSSRGDRYWR